MSNAESPAIAWLLASGEPWVGYNTLVDLVGASTASSQAQAAYSECDLTRVGKILVNDCCTEYKVTKLKILKSNVPGMPRTGNPGH